MPPAPRRLPLTWLDVFTDRRLAGNQLAVVHDADEVDEATMLAFARETRLSETTFVQAADADGADYRNRIWWVGGEMDFAGHPSLGTAVAVAIARGERSARYVQQTRSGLQPVEVEVAADGEAARASMLQNPATFGDELDPVDVAGAVRLTSPDLDSELPPQVVSTGLPHIIVPVVSGALARAAVDPVALGALLDPVGPGVVYLADLDLAAGTARARAFFVDPGANEDPATGSAAGALLAYLQQRRGTDRLDVTQAVEMGRPSSLACSVEGDRMRVGGDCVVVATGTVRL